MVELYPMVCDGHAIAFFQESTQDEPSHKGYSTGTSNCAHYKQD